MNVKAIVTCSSFYIYLLFIFAGIILQSSCSEKAGIHFWSGAIQPTSAIVNVKLPSPAARVRLIVSTNPDFNNTISSVVAASDSSNKTVLSISINGLSPNTKYYYTIEADGKLDTASNDIGSFVTPAETPFSFRFTLGSCLNSNSHHPIFNRMFEKHPLFFLQTGDFHYDNPNSSYNINIHRRPYERLMRNTTYRNFFQHCPLVYIWDDHDYSGNNSDSTAAGKTNARIAYREYIPHYPFGTAITGKDAPIYQAFAIGRVYFILTDLRSSRSRPTMLGTIQKQWFKQQCLYAKEKNLIIAWVSTVPYEGTLPDTWGGFPSERRELADFFNDNDISNMFILSGDSHMIAIDDGTHIDFSSHHNSAYRYPIFQAAALNESGSNKGGKYSGGAFPNPNDSYGQYGLVEVEDQGDSTIQIRFTGYRVNAAGDETKLTSYTFERKLTGLTF